MSVRHETLLDMADANVSVIIPTYGRPDKLLVSLQRILECKPTPAEIIIHVDADDNQTASFTRSHFPRVRLIESNERVGPGGARNRLVQAARCPIVASFDDDSFPIDMDYFDRLRVVFDKFPEAGILLASVFHRGENLAPPAKTFAWVADFIGCGCAYRRSAFLETSGYLPLPTAYGMEEVDMALRLHVDGKRILGTPWLRVFHDTRLKHHNLPAVTAASIANLALLGYLRYPPSLWLTCVGQCLNRILWLLKHGRWRGIISGIMMIPMHLWKYKRYRLPVPKQAVRSYLALRRSPLAAKRLD